MTSTAPLALLNDFSDWLSPMVVKELRQGLRTRLFGLLMLILHGILIVVTLINSAGDNADDTNWVLQGLSILCLCILLPLRGFSAVADEIHKKTLDMLVLTRLSAVRIVLGKWISIVLQALLVALSLMPYVVASYVFGGTDLFAELKLLGLEWLIGVVVAAAVVCLSTQRQFGLRAAVVGLGLLVPLFASLMFGLSRFGGVPVSTTAFWKATDEGALVVWITLAALWLVFGFLTLAATRIAPASSNLAVIKRPVHALVAVGLLIEAAFGKMPGIAIFSAIAFVSSFAAIDAMVERENEVASTLVPFYRRGAWGRFAAWFLTPGWPSGMLYSLVLIGGLTASAFVLEDLDVGSVVWLSGAEVWLCATFVRFTRGKGATDLLSHYIAIALILYVAKIFVSILCASTMHTEEGRDSLAWVGMLLPGTVPGTLAQLKAYGASSGPPDHLVAMQLTGLGLSCLWPLIMSFLAARVLLRSRSLREEARQTAKAA